MTRIHEASIFRFLTKDSIACLLTYLNTIIMELIHLYRAQPIFQCIQKTGFFYLNVKFWLMIIYFAWY